MKITALECLHASAGIRTFDFLKISTDEGLVGWSEYNEAFGGKGVTSVIENLAPLIVGRDPRAYEAITTYLFAIRRQAIGGVIQQALGAIENALLDVKAKALGIPVYEMLGGPLRDRLRLYWSHCGTYRVTSHAAMQIKPVRTLDDVAELGREVAASGMTALKTNVMIFGDDAHMHVPGFARARENFPALNAERREINAIRDELTAFREGTGPDIDILVDLNFNYKTEGFRKMARAMEPFDLFWVEIDSYSPAALRTIRDSTIIPLASGECLFHRRGYQPFFETHAMDTVIIDTPWNGVAESLKIASVADTYEINVAPHNFYGHLATMMNAHFCAVVPNFRIMEIDLDRAPWYDDLVTVPSRIENGHLVLPDGPGWGTDVNEEAVRAHPPQ